MGNTIYTINLYPAVNGNKKRYKVVGYTNTVKETTHNKQHTHLDMFYLKLHTMKKKKYIQNITFITLKLLQFLVTLHTYTTIYNSGDKTGHNNNR